MIISISNLDRLRSCIRGYSRRKSELHRQRRSRLQPSQQLDRKDQRCSVRQSRQQRRWRRCSQKRGLETVKRGGCTFGRVLTSNSGEGGFQTSRGQTVNGNGIGAGSRQVLHGDRRAIHTFAPAGTTKGRSRRGLSS